MSPTQATWSAETRSQIRELQDSLLTLSGWAKDCNAGPAETELLLSPYRDLLEELYEHDLPLAKLVEESDLLLHARGPAASGPTPRVTVLARLLTYTRDQVTRLAKQLAGVTSLRVPPSLDMAFTGVAGGSLFVGFKADSAEDGNLTRDAIKAIADVSHLVSEEGTVQQIASVIDDPAARDIALDAVRQLSPSGQIGISEIEILGAQISQPTSLTTETRRQARGVMAQKASEEARVEFIGTVREVDLDAHRFEIRNVEGQVEDVRCAHELDDEDVKELVGKRIRVRGVPEYSKRGTRRVVRLLWVDELEWLPA